MDQVNKQAVVVPMRFYANWDVDRTSSSAIQRTLSMIFTRLVLTKTLSTDISLIIAVRMQGTRRRTLRSNDITISPSSLDIPLDISFTIQYCHFIKRKSNNLQILIQRRKKYKNRQIPGFKTLAVGHINLDEILQQGGSREVAVWDTTCLNKSGPTVKELHAGTIFIANCFTQVVEQDVHKWNKSSTSKGDSNVLMSEEENDDYSSPEDSDFEDFDRSARRPGEGGSTSSRKRQQINNRQTRKKIKQKNIKQKVVALLRRFRIPDEEDNAAAATGSTTSSRVMPPTELELQEIFEELENISDSGPELEPDKMSIVSNPRPGIRPFFAEGSKTDALPAIEDQLHSDDSVDLVDSEEQEMSSEDNLKDSNFWIQQIPPLADLHSTEHNLFPLGFDSPNVPKDLSSLSAKEKMKHSSTINSMSSPANPPSTELGKRIISNKKSQDGAAVLLDLLSQADSQCVVPANIWLTSSADLPWLCRLDSSLLVNVRIFDCPCLTDVRTGIQAIIGRIQKFCNSNSASPTTTRIGVLGGDKLVSQVLRAYVDLLQNKTCQEWLNYLRFSLIVPPSSAIGRLLAQITDGGYSEILWKRLSQISSSNFDPAASSSLLSSSDHQEVDACLSSVAGNLILESQQRSVNLSVGEVMLQLESGMLFDPLTMDTEKDNSQIFVPFLSELHLGNLEESSSPLYYMKGSLDEGGNNNGNNASNNASPLPSSHSQSFPTFSAITGNLSPPVSPHSQKNYDGRELHVEYWTCSDRALLTGQSTPSSISAATAYTYQEQYPVGQNSSSFKNCGTPNSAGSKFSMKASVRTLSVAREPTTNLLCILFVKDKKKDKVLQKLGRKNKQRSSNDFANSHSRIVSSVSRMVCSSGSSNSNKNQCFLDVLIDGNRWKRIRFFQISHQWQTHVKLFPISFPLVSGLTNLNK